MARIAIDLARRVGTADRRIFGNFIEHFGRCIYGGVFEEGSPLSDARVFRQDVLEAFGRVHPLADLGPFSFLDAVATCGAKHELTIGVVNRDRDRSQATIELGSVATTGELQLHVAEVNGPDVGATHSFEHADRVGVREHPRPVGESRFEYEFPAHSVSVLRVRLAS